VVNLPEVLQTERLAQRDGISLDEAAKIMKSQLPLAEKLQFADYVIDNSRNLESTRSQVEKIWDNLCNKKG
jgi:dephospho-CoA kinase